MAGLGSKQIIAIVLSVGLVVLLIFAPRHQGDVVVDAAEATQDNEPPTVENQIDSALAIIAGEAPMQGILLLRQIAEENPTNFRAQFNLGRFSAQTGQWEKSSSHQSAAPQRHILQTNMRLPHVPSLLESWEVLQLQPLGSLECDKHLGRLVYLDALYW